MEKNNIIKFLIPLASVVVIIESVVVISNIASTKKVKVASSVSESNLVAVIPEIKPMESSGGVQASMVFEVGNRAMKVGNSYPISLNLTTKQDLQIDSFDLYIKYDPSAFDVNSLSFDKQLGKPTFSKVSTDKGDDCSEYIYVGEIRT